MAKEIPLTNGGAVIVDDDLYPQLSQHRWLRAGRNRRYVIRMEGKKWIMLGRVVAGAGPERYVAWRNGNTMDCRRENLFIGTHGEALNLSRGGNGVTRRERAAQQKNSQQERLTAKRIARFYSKVQKGAPDECWNWKGHKIPFGYGVTSWKSRPLPPYEYAHRIAWMLANKSDIPAGMLVRHKCDNPSCCNPAHLELGTQSDNIADRQSRGRHHATGSRGIKDEIARLRLSGNTYAQISDTLDCSFYAVHYACKKHGLVNSRKSEKA